jgi:mRNA interferase MazF
VIGKRNTWVPDRREIIWIDCNPQVGREMRDVHPLLVISPRIFNEKTSLVIGLPMTTAEYNSDNPFAIAAGKVIRPQDRTNKLRALPSAKILRLAFAQSQSTSPRSFV